MRLLFVLKKPMDCKKCLVINFIMPGTTSMFFSSGHLIVNPHYHSHQCVFGELWDVMGPEDFECFSGFLPLNVQFHHRRRSMLGPTEHPKSPSSAL